jgi:hypothetical protein
LHPRSRLTASALTQLKMGIGHKAVFSESAMTY